MKGSLIIISSPSGGGKGTLIRRLREDFEGLSYSVSHTTREIRKGEEDGVHYNFVSTERFEELIEAGEFLEYAEVHGNYYGTSKAFINKELEKGFDVLLEIDVQGAEWVRKRAPEAVGIFILPPSYAVLKERLSNRNTESETDLAVRLRNASDEVKQYKHFDFVIINDDLEKAVEDLKSVVRSGRLLRDRQTKAVRDILVSFDNAE